MSPWDGVGAGADGYAIRPARAIEEFDQLSSVFREVFATSERGAPPPWLMDDLRGAGGLTLGLWHEDRPVGFSFSFAGVEDGDPYLFSSGLGVLPGHRAGGFALAMKRAQREYALELGYRRIRWTFSALRTVNAHLYTSRLGAVGVGYIPDKRGALAGEWGTEGGVPFDEFLVEWELESPRTLARLGGGPAPPLEDAVRIVSCRDGLPEVSAGWLERARAADRVALELPADYQALVDRDPDSALRWHRETQPLLVALFAAGYVLSECGRAAASGRALYLLERSESGGAGADRPGPAL
jgi:predicted GNAT superfamily acetyltransferase